MVVGTTGGTLFIVLGIPEHEARCRHTEPGIVGPLGSQCPKFEFSIRV
jgi:hypothetical protein